MNRFVPLLPILLLALPIQAWGQAAGSLPPPVPRSAVPATPTPPAAPREPSRPPAAAQPFQPPAQPPARREAAPAAPVRQNPPQARAPARAAPPNPPRRPQAEPKTVGPQQPQPARRPRAAAAAAGVAAGAAAGAAATPAPQPAPEPEPQPSTGNVTGLPLPRFAALRAEEVNMRAGPGTRYPIEWTYQRRDLPVEIVREFELWRRIRDMEGTEGWVHQSNLTGRRNFIVTGQERVLRRRPEESANTVAHLRPGVVGRIRLCPTGETWCEVQVGEHRGFLRRGDFFGTLPGEEVK